MRSHNTICFYLSILIIVSVLVAVNIVPFYSGYVMLSVSLFAFVTEAIYFRYEAGKLKNKKKQIIPLEKEKEYVIRNIVFVVLGIAGIAATFISLELRFAAQVLFIILVLWGVRGLIFKTQAMKSLRIDDQYIESGFLASPFELKNLSAYEIDPNDQKLLLTNNKGKVFKIRIRGLEDPALLEQLLREALAAKNK
jgi:hypothetical protein